MSILSGMNVGRFNKRVGIYRYKETTNDIGATVNDLVLVKTVWAEIRPYRGNEQLEYYKAVNSTAIRVTMRHTDISAKDVLKYHGREFEVQYVNDLLEDDAYDEVVCTEILDHEAT